MGARIENGPNVNQRNRESHKDAENAIFYCSLDSMERRQIIMRAIKVPITHTRIPTHKRHFCHFSHSLNYSFIPFIDPNTHESRRSYPVGVILMIGLVFSLMTSYPIISEQRTYIRNISTEGEKDAFMINYFIGLK